ncbi:MAG: RNA polymerase sigma factor [Bacteroidota bacterium]
MSNTEQSSSYQINPAEKELVEACLREDRKAQKQLFDLYKDAMYTLCYRITSDTELAQDALQEGFVGVFRGMKNFRKESSLGAWIKTIMVRTAYKKIRKESRFQSLDEEVAEQLIDWGSYIDVSYLEQAIQALPPGYRTVFVMIEVEGYSHKEVAATMGISVGTSKSQLFYAKKHLQKKLKALGVRS